MTNPPAKLICAMMIIATTTIPAPGAEEMIDVGGHRLTMISSGQGSPTVVFESGMGGNAIQRWDELRLRISEFTSVVCYARAGRGGSEPATSPRTPAAITEDLHVLLERAGYKPPYVLVGASWGGIYVRTFAMRYPKDVVGLVLIDIGHERWNIERDPNKGITPARRAEITAKEMARLAEKTDAASLEVIGAAEIETAGSLSVFGQMPDIPTVVFTSVQNLKRDPTSTVQQEGKALLRRLHSELFQASTHAMHIVTSTAGHGIYGDDPDLVVNAIRWVVEEAREGKFRTGLTKSPPASRQVLLSEVTGPDNLVFDQETGLRAKLPAGWKFTGASRSTGSDKIGSAVSIGFSDSGAAISGALRFFVHEGDAAPGSTEIDASLRTWVETTLVQLRGGGYKYRPASFSSTAIENHRALAWTGDFTRNGENWVELGTVVHGKKGNAFVRLQAPSKAIEQYRADFERLVNSVRLP